MPPRKTVDRASETSNSPARILTKCAPYRNTGGAFIPSVTELHAEHESPNERLAMAHLALCSDVETIASQPWQDTYRDDGGKLRRYIPDFVVSNGTYRLIIEVKALAFLTDEESLRKYAAIARHYLAEHQPFAFLVDVQLEESPRAASVRLLFRYCTSVAPTPVLELARAGLVHGALQIGELCRRARIQLVDVYTLIATKHLCIDWGHPLSTNAMVSLPGKPYEGLKLEHILRATRFGHFLEELAVGRRPTDRRMLADAQTWRQSRRAPTPYCFVGGFPTRQIVGGLRDEDSLSYAAERRGNHSPGLNFDPTDSDL
ncbi:hypothetical protein [Pandoraea sputorum]|uniref:hypothetical protein n=1 Tax=Pandoraea sputorum TaxID=93222 RepID=UPI002AF6B2AA|nr:hypothetical protein [Pandoraea sputorum]